MIQKISTSTLLLLFVSLLLGCFDEPQNIEIGIEAPLQAIKGESFVIHVSVRNTASEPQTLVSLDVGEDYLDGIAIAKTVPEHSAAEHIPLDNTMSYDFNQSIAPGATLKIDLYAQAIKTGDFKAGVDYCINDETSFLTKQVRTVVAESNSTLGPEQAP